MSEPIQKRAQRTEELLLNAAEGLLRKGGVEACSVPEIARLSKRSVGAVYRRFPDKNALLESVFRRYFRRLGEQNRGDSEKLATEVDLESLVSTIVRGIVEGQRRDRRIIAALIPFARAQSSKEFRHEAQKLSRDTLMRLRTMLLAHGEEFAHPDPPGAVDVVLATVSLISHGLAQRDELSPLSEIDDASLIKELTRMVLAYLGRP